MQNRNVLAVLVILVVVLIGFMALTTPDRRTTSERVGDAISALPEGPDRAARELERRTPGERLGDAVEDTGERISRSTDNQ
jgi:hypothetical protein